MFNKADGTCSGVVQSINDSGTYLTVNGTTSSITVKAKKKCHVHGFYLTSGGTTQYIDADYSAGNTILSGSMWILISAN